MGGSSTRKPLGDSGDKLKNSFVGDVANMTVKSISGGAYSLDKTGYMQLEGGPLKGDNMIRGMAASGTSNLSEGYYAKKAKGEELAKEAKAAAKTTQDKLLGAAKQREADEAATKSEVDNVARAKALQDRRSKGKGRASTILTSSEGTSSTLGQSGTGKALLGI